MSTARKGDVHVSTHGHVTVLEIRRPPNNFFDLELIGDLSSLVEGLDDDVDCRAIVLASEGKAFCAGADFQRRPAELAGALEDRNPLYSEAVRLFRNRKPIVAAVQGPAIGGGFGLSLVADFRVAAPEARFGANFVKLGIHPGFGLTHTLPRLVGVQKANWMFMTGRRLTGEEAAAIGLVDLLVPAERLRDAAMALAQEIAEGAPLAVQSTRATLRRGLADAVQAQTDHEFVEQKWLARTEDHREGILAVSERRAGRFVAR
ncbi:enoyl-CoA hydratase [Tistrella bauzanensis]|uniref:Enoyl-CoA hydratase n=1 Tax=Tistrella bauzanensis TaxID=657419 RepID=A0ABQ1IJV4_9PROT|nr:enoyl-CoA hydratase/isomerase family protein [Tistrella bauzanensis]GGB41564.1 enoyl-CoA hydratase [Tistrella bauzanensis]